MRDGPGTERLRRLRRRDVAGFLLIWAAVCAVVLLGYQLVERRWWGGPPSETSAVTPSARALVAALVATAAAGAWLLGRLFPSLESGLGGGMPDGPEGRLARRRRIAAWFLGLRWIAVLLAGGVVGFATRVIECVPPASAPRLWGGVALLAAFNGILSALGPRRLASQRSLAVQVAGDVVVLGWFVHHAGGLLNPFAGFFVFHSAIAGIVLEPPRARRVAFAIAGFVLALTAVEATGVLPPGCLLDATGACAAGGDWLHVVGSGAAVAATVVGSTLLIVPLVRALRTERENLRSIIDCMADGVLYVTPDGRVQLHNRAARRLWSGGDPPTGDLRVCHPADRWRRLLERLADPGPVEFHPVFAVDGRTYEGSYARVRDVEGALRGVVMIARDVTDRLEAQRLRMQEERMAVVGKLAAGLAHELNNPLGAIALFTQHALSQVPAGEPLAEHLETVRRNADLCKKIVRDLLVYARQRPPERRTVAIRALVGDVARTLEPRAARSGVAVVQEAGGADPVVRCDPDQLRQVLVNLGLNAIEAMPDGGTLTFRVAGDGRGIRVEVADTGPGIPPDARERIFTAFHTTKPEGTGLGLTVAHDLITAHGGAIELDSEPGRGSTFAVVLPPSPGEEEAIAS